MILMQRVWIRARHLKPKGPLNPVYRLQTQGSGHPLPLWHSRDPSKDHCTLPSNVQDGGCEVVCVYKAIAFTWKWDSRAAREQWIRVWLWPLMAGFLPQLYFVQDVGMRQSLAPHRLLRVRQPRLSASPTPDRAQLVGNATNTAVLSSESISLLKRYFKIRNRYNMGTLILPA